MQRVLSAEELRGRKDGEFVRTAGCVIARQRPGTAKGFIFLSMEDDTSIANVVVTPDLSGRLDLHEITNCSRCSAKAGGAIVRHASMGTTRP
jgi:hypothetical protein